ncbi:MAG: hypothetical protein PHI91_02265 [Candidatus Pacebacteria bacterium]|nr:hypothetical protein [Candidatus Paceibacterota bacterium]MDD2757237.1 hypothetical protein [Candidatus Paceibacterota bacterium]MDD3283787.1 hypothetical protein [Candidatus Paceibacterota bacterium]MDD3969993.1 hypothetical protein [Candidatus Paceibacterota bacterium]MDD4738256.1 hypothetical protein [Candidatus Paceibacterota bacterium]
MNFEQPQKEENNIAMVKFGDKEVPCRKINFKEEFPASFFDDAKEYRKTALVNVRVAENEETITSSQDANKTIIAEPGDMIIHNPGDVDPYVFGNRDDSVEERQRKFAEKYEQTDEDGVYRSKGVIKAKKVNENLVWDTSWGSQDGVIAGGWISNGGYAIAEDSFANTYEEIED